MGKADDRRAALMERTVDDLERYLDRQVDFENLLEELRPWLSPRQYAAGEALVGPDAPEEGLQLLLSRPGFRVRFDGRSSVSVRPRRCDMASQGSGPENDFCGCERSLPNNGADAGHPGLAGAARRAAYPQAIPIPSCRASSIRIGSGAIASGLPQLRPLGQPLLIHHVFPQRQPRLPDCPHAP